MRSTAHFCVAGFALVVIAITVPAHGVTRSVDHAGGGDYLTIQEGIDAADEGDTVAVAQGTYTGTLNRSLDFGGKNLVLTSVDGPHLTTIDCEGASRGILFQSGEDASSWLFGFTITNGSDFYGGGVYCVTSSPTIANCIFESNSALLTGGAMLIVANSSPAVINCVFENNEAHDLSGAGGGAVYCEQFSAPVFTSCRFEGNTADQNGGAVCTFFASPTFEACMFVDNGALNLGGAIMAGANATPSFDTCTFVENQALDGGVMFASQSPGSITNSVMALNDGGGTVFCGDCTPEITHCLIYENVGGDSLCGDYHDNLFTDPLFCHPIQDSYGLYSDSPCLPDFNAWGEQIGATGSGGCGTGVSGWDEGSTIDALVLHAPSPNPFSGATSISCTVPSGAATLRVEVFSAGGRRVRTMVDRGVGRTRQMTWDGLDDRGERVAAGVYFVRASSGAEVADGKVLLIK